MDKDGYVLYQNDSNIYTFVSEGNSGKIIKAIVFQEIEANVFNLVLADYNVATMSLSDNTVSNNNDISRIMATVVKTIAYFFESNPKASIYIQANTRQKSLLYNRIFKNYISEISTKYIVKGQNNSTLENYVLGNSYESFYICLI